MGSVRHAAVSSLLIVCACSLLGCATTGGNMTRDYEPAHEYVSGDSANRGYKFQEASQFIEFCVELDSQDDRMTAPDNPHFVAQINPLLWNPVPVYDSRKAVAQDVVDFKDHGETPQNSHWAKLYREIIDRAEQHPPSAWTAQALSNDPRYNGFGPYQSAWVLYEGRNENAGAYAIAIRGTVFSALPSAVEDALFHPVVAKHFLNPAVSFASFDDASLHSGFAHATFSLLLDDRYGILRVLHDRAIPANTHLYIVGHSQGAAMASLTHAFFHYAMLNATEASNPFDLYGKNLKLKSYAFAQPKPGNFAFAADFASITQGTDNAIVINNAIDPVPQVPLTLQDLGDIDGDIPGSSLGAKALHFVSGIGSGFRGAIGRIAEPFVKKDDAGYGYYFNYSQLGSIGQDQTASSWNFMAAGHVILVFGKPGDGSEPFLQHHAWIYRGLIREQLQGISEN